MLISVVAVVLAASAPAFVRALRVSKVSEAPSNLASLARHAAGYYAAVHPTPDGLRTSCLPESAGPAPAEPSPTPISVAFGAPETPGAASWLALGFELSEPIRYRYSIIAAGAGCSAADSGLRSLVLRAEGDLDGDGELSLFERTLTVTEGELQADPLLFARDRIE